MARLVSLPLPRFTKIWENSQVKQCFNVGEDGRLHHKRLDSEREKQETFRRRQSDNGQKGGRPRNPEKPRPFENESQPSTVGLARKSSSSSTPVIPPNPPRGAVDDLPDGWGEDFYEGIKAVYRKARNGAAYVPKEARDTPLMVETLVRTYQPLERLLQMYEWFLVKDSYKPKNIPGTIGQFAHMAPQCDAELRAHGR